MNRNTWQRIARGIVAVAFTGLAVGANATVYYDSRFDPLGSTYSFSGYARFAVDDACLTVDGAKFANTATCHVSMISAYIDLVENANTAHTQHVDFASVLPSTNVIDILVQNHQMIGVDTGVIGSEQVTNSGIFTGFWWLQYICGAACQPQTGGGDHHHDYDDDPVFVYYAATSTGCRSVTSANCQTSTPATTITFARVPEPATLALVISALGAGLWTRRRKSRAA